MMMRAKERKRTREMTRWVTRRTHPVLSLHNSVFILHECSGVPYRVRAVGLSDAISCNNVSCHVMLSQVGEQHIIVFPPIHLSTYPSILVRISLCLSIPHHTTSRLTTSSDIISPSLQDEEEVEDYCPAGCDRALYDR